MTLLDAVVVGGGITGAGIARLAARHGLRVALLERGDLASGASSASSHMLHGGLRYLEHGHFGLVREALRERAAVSRMAPDLARPVRFLVPIYRGDRRPSWKIRLGLSAYDAFSGRRGLARHSFIRAREALALEPSLQQGHLRAAGLYSDVVMDDARLAVAVAADAALHGAAIHTYTEAVGMRPQEGGVEVLARDRLTGAELRLPTRLVFNATGPWVDRTRRGLLASLHPGAPDPAPLLRPSRGVHLLFQRLTRGHGLLLFARADDRVFFVVPFGQHSLVGTTEVEVSSPPGERDGEPSVEEIRYLRAELARALPSAADAPPLAWTSGIRPLLASAEGVGQAPREHRVFEDGPMLTVAGGKFTTFRAMARDAVEAAARRLQRGGPPVRDSEEPLPRLPAWGPELETFVEAAVERTFARRLEDVVRRRSALWLTPDRGRVAAPGIAAALARKLGWSPARTRQELRDFESGLEREERLLGAAREVA